MRYVASLIFSLLAVTSFGQNKTFDDYLFRNQYIDCRDVEYNAFSVVNQLYQRKQYDSIYLFLDYWRSKCGANEQQFRVERVLDIRAGKFHQDQITGEWFDYLVEYKTTQFEGYGYDKQIVNDVTTNRLRFDYLIQRMATEIPPQENIDAKLLLEFYSTNAPSFEKIKNTSPEESKLSRFYHMESDAAEKMMESNIAAFFGYIQPRGNMSVLGVRPTIGVMVGVKQLRHSFDLVGDIRIGPASHPYMIQYNDTLLKIRDYTGIYLGVEYGYHLLNRKKVVLALSSGIGYEGMTALYDENEYGDEGKKLRTFNVNTGLTFRWFIKDERYIGLQARYHFVNFSNTGGTDISGDYFNLRLLYGSTSTPDKKRRKRLLE